MEERSHIFARLLHMWCMGVICAVEARSLQRDSLGDIKLSVSYVEQQKAPVGFVSDNTYQDVTRWEWEQAGAAVHSIATLEMNAEFVQHDEMCGHFVA